MEKERKSKLTEKFTTLIFYLSILFFFIAFNFQDSKTGGWYQQWLPNLNGEQLKDITFLDSLTGYGITNSYIIKTTNGGDNWVINSTANLLFSKVQFVNKDTGYVSAGLNKLYKTYNGGNNWTVISLPTDLYPNCMYVLNKDILWLGDYESLTGGLFKSTDGGFNWFRQFYLFNSNPINIYMYNKNIGFMMTNDNQTLKTINGGDNWFQVIANHGFSDIYFSDSLTGWIARPYKTTDGGITWIDHYSNLPKIFQNVFYQMSKFSKDTIWGVGGSEYYNGYRAIVYRTTNGGTNWGYQRLDTSVHAFRYEFCNFVNKLNGWAYYLTGSGIHTVVGGNDTTIFTGINNNGTIISNEFILYQNYPNPFNPVSSIKYQVLRSAEIKLIIYNITGKEITTLVNKKQTSGIYEVKFDGGTLSSGIYFYTLFADEVRVDTKKMLMIK